jgi:nicotinate-nucleotide adenylyltransferase
MTEAPDGGAVQDGTAVTPPAPVLPGSVGILGGTFDPIHHGHLAIAEEAREALGLERVLFMPASLPPHKPGRPVTGPEHRLAMVRLAVAGNPAFEASDLEVRRGGVSYTVDTLERIVADGVPRPWLILSSEALALLPTWREPRRILALARLAVVPRDGFDPLGPAWVEGAFPGAADRVTFLPGPLLPISGSVVRRRAHAGRSVRYLVPDAVAAYIAQHRLYA